MVRCIYSPFSDIYFHLAAEEYWLKQGKEDVFMLWQSPPSVVIGRHQQVQREADREYAERQGIRIARRFSGGGAVYHDAGNVNLTFIETVSRLPDFAVYLQRTLDFLATIGIAAEGDERLGIYLHGRKISGSAQCVYKNRILYHCTLLYDTDLPVLERVLNPEQGVEEDVSPEEEDTLPGDKKTSHHIYTVPSVRSKVTNIRPYFSGETVDDFKKEAFLYFSQFQCVSSFRKEEVKAIYQFREEKYSRLTWIYNG